MKACFFSAAPKPRVRVRIEGEMKGVIDGIEVFTFAMHRTPSVPYDELPRRQDITGYPVDGQEYRDDAHPNVIFVARSGKDWSRYRFEAWVRDPRSKSPDM